MAATSMMKVGCSKVIMGPGVTPCSISAPSSMAAGGLPGIPRFSSGIMAPPTQALLAVSLARTPCNLAFAKGFGMFGCIFGRAVGNPAGDVFTDAGNRTDADTDQGGTDDGREYCGRPCRFPG